MNKKVHNFNFNSIYVLSEEIYLKLTLCWTNVHLSADVTLL